MSMDGYMELKKVKISEIKPYAGNPRKNKAAVDAVAESIKQCDYIAPIIVDENMEVLAGHTRLKALKKLGRKNVEIVVKAGLTEEQKRKYRLLDNKTNELAEWDIPQLAIELEGLDFEGLDIDWGIPDISAELDTEEPEDYAEATLRRADNILNLEYAEFEGVPPYDIPAIKGTTVVPNVKEWIGFNYVMSDTEPSGKGVHFFIDDYQFERVWNEPERYVEKLKQYEAVLAPDFSPWGDMPFVLQLYNHYRKHWCAAYWQMNGINVIPTIRASSDKRSELFYLSGEPKNSVIAVSLMWNSTRDEKDVIDGYKELMEALEPTHILIYGDVPDYVEDGIATSIPMFTDKYKER